MDQYMWFKCTEPYVVVDIVCAELCGWGHYKMSGRATFESRADYDKWLEQKYAEQETRRVVQVPSK
jgi:cytochrome c oxidase subunit 2